MLIYLLSPIALADPLPGVVSTDAFDETQGAQLAECVTTPTVGWSAPSSCPENSFADDRECGPEDGVGFWTDMGNTSDAACEELTLPYPICLVGVRVFAFHDTDAFLNRSMRDLRVYADPYGSNIEFVGSPIAVPYGNQSGNTAAQSYQLDLTLSGPPITADTWRFEVIQNVEANSPYNGVRVVEIDAIPCADADGDGLDGSIDCDDLDPTVGAGTPEVCNGLDDDCDGEVDEEGGSDWYADMDEDGYGDGPATSYCTPPAGWVAVDGDCDDANPDANPGAIEECDGVDDNCDGQIDEGLASARYIDGDGDGFGDDATAFFSCTADAGTVELPGDCDDSDSAVNPSATEVCDGVDQDCDGSIDEGLLLEFYADLDGDGFGSGDPVPACSAPANHVADAGDCDDSDSAVNPSAAEVCDPDGIDEDCDGLSGDEDPDVIGLVDGFADLDGDGYGDPDNPVQVCAEQLLIASTDCDDSDPSIHPGATELGDDGIDQDCDGEDGVYRYRSGCAIGPVPPLSGGTLVGLGLFFLRRRGQER